MNETKVPSIPTVPTTGDAALLRFLSAVRETILVREGHKGNELDGNVTFRDLINAGIAVSSKYTPDPNTSTVVDPAAITDSTPPPEPSQINVSAGTSCVMITWVLPDNSSNLAYIKIWRSTDNVFSNAQIIGTGTGSMYVDYSVIDAQPYHYWLQAISTSDVAGNVIDAGIATPATDPTGALTQLKPYGIEGLPYYYIPADTVVNGVTLTKGTYLWDAVIGTAAIGTAQIKDAAITSAKIDSITANKITFNEASGQVFSAAVITGGLISGTTITGNTIKGGSIEGSHIWAGGTEEYPAAEMLDYGSIRTNSATMLGGKPKVFTEMTEGDVVRNVLFPNGANSYLYQPTKALSRVEAGIAQNAEIVTLPGYWEEAPNIIVSINSMQLYNAGSASVNQKVVCTAENISRLSTDINSPGYNQFKFTPTAYITVDGSNGTIPVMGQQVILPESSSYLPMGTYNSNAFVIPANVTSGTVSYTEKMWYIDDVDSGSEQADWWYTYIVPTLYVNGVAVAVGTPVMHPEKSSAARTFTFDFASVPAGSAYVSFNVYISGKNNNSTSVWKFWWTYTSYRRYLQINNVSVVSKTATGLASGVLSYLAVGR